jgi:flagellar basal body-associated protein FliL
MLLLWILLGVLFTASLLAAAALIAVAVRGGSALPSDLQEESLTIDQPPANLPHLPQSAAGGLAAGDAADG